MRNLLVEALFILLSLPLHRRDAVSLSQDLSEGRLTAVELMTATLDRIEAINPTFHAIIAQAPRDILLQQASQADKSPRKGWLHGIPIAIKDLSNAQGFPTTLGGSPLADPNVLATTSDPFVQRLVNSGAMVIGKTNSPESGLGSHTFNHLWGTTPNPYNTSCSAGGSSGGAAVALATGMLAVADGSDMMGSLRNPAGWNHLYSLRPTAGVLECVPNELLDYPISTVGPMARTVQDLRAMYETMVEPRRRGKKETIKENYRIAWLGSWGLPMEEGITKLCEETLVRFQEQYSKVRIDDLSDKCIYPMDALWMSWTDIRSALVSRETLASHGMKAVLGSSCRVRKELQWEVQRGLEMSKDQLSRATTVANEFSRHLFTNVFTDYDVLALPTAQVWPFPKEWAYPEAIGSRGMDTYHRWMQVVVPASLAGLPVLTVPAGFNENGLPMGIQFVGQRGRDNQLLDLAKAFESAVTFSSAFQLKL